MELLPFDKEEFVRYLDNAKNLLDKAAELGAELAGKDYDSMVFVGCGAPNRDVRVIQHYTETHMLHSPIKTFLPAEFIHINPKFINNKTVVVFGSYSGTTWETVDAARFCKDKECLTICITRFDDSPLSKEVQTLLNYGDTKLGDYSRFMVTSALISGFLSVHEPEQWIIHESIMSSLRAFPRVLGNVVEQSETMVKSFSEKYHHIDTLYAVGNGPVYNIAYMMTFCSFVEMQWMNATPVIAAEFFHGPFEIVDDSFPVIVLIGEDETREEGLRVAKFCQKHLSKYLIVDSADYEMPGIDPKLRSFFSAFVVDAATRRFMDYYAELRGHDKTKRRYMGVIEY